MDQFPDWLEPLVVLENFNGDPILYIEHIFSLFSRDFINSKTLFKGKVVLFDKADDDGKPRTFVHITTEENRKTGERELCLRRCERIGWIKAIIEHADDPDILVWKKEQQTGKRLAIRTYLFLEKENFLVILQEIKWAHYMVTAIYIDNPNQKRKHLKAHSKFKGGSM